jgi:putative tributyrin esterase
MKRLRLSLLVLALLATLAAFYYHRENAVRVETVNLHSQITGMDLPYSVVLPRGYGLFLARKNYPVLYLLHGHGGDHSSWIANTPLTTNATNFNVIIVMPEGREGWYTDSATANAAKYETYIVKELIPDVESRYRVIRERNGRAIAGYSMGGYGALKFALKYPDLFVFAGSLSGAFDAPLRNDDISIRQTFGSPDNPVRDANNLSKLASGVSKSALPYLYFDCGTADPWLKTNRELASTFASLGIKHDYRELKGTHDWAYWSRQEFGLLQLAANTMTPAHR